MHVMILSPRVMIFMGVVVISHSGIGGSGFFVNNTIFNLIWGSLDHLKIDQIHPYTCTFVCTVSLKLKKC